MGPAPPGLPATFTGGWVGNVGYDTVRYGYSSKLPFAAAPRDDRNLPDLHFGLYNNVIIFDHAQKLAYIVAWVHVGNHPSTAAAYKYGREQTAHIVQKLSRGPEPEMPKGNRVDMALQGRSAWKEDREGTERRRSRKKEGLGPILGIIEICAFPGLRPDRF